MSGYTRGGVQLTSIRAAPSPAPTVPTITNNLVGNGSTPSAPVATGSQYSAGAFGYTRGAYAGAYHGGQAQGASQPRAAPVIMDDFERWYTEKTPTNRMVLSLRSGIDSEAAWALDRLCRLCANEQFVLASIPGLIDALFEWPEWFVKEYADTSQATNSKGRVKSGISLEDSLFRVSPSVRSHRRFAIESLFVLRNASFTEQNANELAALPRTQALIFQALELLTPFVNTSDACAEFVLHIVELLHSIIRTVILPPLGSENASSPSRNPIPALERLTSESSDRSIIISSLIALTHLLSMPKNAAHGTASSPALTVALRNLALYSDTALIDASVSFLYAHLSYPPMTKAFLLHPDMPATLRVLVGFIIAEQVDEEKVVDVTGPRHVAPIIKTKWVNKELTAEELEKIGSMPEPERCYSWMRNVFMAAPEEEVTQVEFWTNYKEHFTRFQDRHNLLVASDVIKYVGTVYAQAQAMVLPGPPQRFVIRGITRNKKEVSEEYKCQWERGSCPVDSCQLPKDLYEHLQTHLELLNMSSAVGGEKKEFSCSWATCQHSAATYDSLRPHVWTHIPLRSAARADTSQPPKVAFSTATEKHLTATPTERVHPPPPNTRITYPSPARDPSSTALTALLVIRTLFRASFALVEAAPRADADHFGFPGVVEEMDEAEQAQGEVDGEAEEEGARRGRKAFIGVRHLMESVRIRDPALMAWIVEMIDVSM